MGCNASRSGFSFISSHMPFLKEKEPPLFLLQHCGPWNGTLDENILSHVG